MFELSENKRQSKDPLYASLLNRIRIGSMTTEDVQTLNRRVVSTTMDVKKMLHIFPLKKDREGHNQELIKIASQETTIYEIHAIHNVPDDQIPLDDQKCAGIPKILHLCQNARVMLIRNLDTTEGLVNGAQGTVHSIEWVNGQNTMPRCVNVLFDDKNIFPSINNNICEPIGIRPISVTFLGNNNTYVTRTQIPLVLSFATTIHKVQGLTLNNAVCDKGPAIFRGGMAYVALSRVTTLQDLYLLKLCPPRIYPASSVTKEMDRLRKNIQ